MSAPDDGGKPAQLGLVDMGDIRFYDDPTYYPPSFNTSDLTSYTGSFSEMVLNVAWQQLQPAQGQLNTSVIDSALAAVNSYNAQNGTNLGIKLRVWGGYQAPEWAKTIDGPAVTITGQATVDPYIYSARTIGRYWTADYIEAWSNAAEPAGQPLRQQSHHSRHFPDGRRLGHRRALRAAQPRPHDHRPRAHGEPDPRGAAAGYTDAAEMLTLRARDRRLCAVDDDAARLHDQPFHLFDSGNASTDPNFTLAVLQQARNSTRIVQPGNHALQTPDLLHSTFLYAQMTADAALDPATTQGSFQTESPIGLAASASFGTNPASPGPWPTGLTPSPTACCRTAATSSCGTARAEPPSGFRASRPARRSPGADRSPPAWPRRLVRPATARRSASSRPPPSPAVAGTAAFSGTDAVLLASGATQNFYAVQRHADLARTAARSPSPISAASCRARPAARPSPLGPARPREHGAGEPARTRLVAAPTWCASRRPTSTGNRGPHRRRPGRRCRGSSSSAAARAATPARGAQGNGILVDRRRAAPRSIVPGNLQIGPGGSYARCSPRWRRAPTARRSLTVGGTLEIESAGTARFTGRSVAPLRHRRRRRRAGRGGRSALHAALGRGPITNNGTIEAVADLTLGLQRLIVSNALTGSGTLADRCRRHAGAGRHGRVQARPSRSRPTPCAQFSNGPYSPSTLVLVAPLGMFGPPSAASRFADRLVLDGVSANTAGVTYTAAARCPSACRPDSPSRLSGSPAGRYLSRLRVTSASGSSAETISFVTPTVERSVPQRHGAPERSRAPSAWRSWCRTSSLNGAAAGHRARQQHSDRHPFRDERHPCPSRQHVDQPQRGLFPARSPKSSAACAARPTRVGGWPPTRLLITIAGFGGSSTTSTSITNFTSSQQFDWARRRRRLCRRQQLDAQPAARRAASISPPSAPSARAPTRFPAMARWGTSRSAARQRSPVRSPPRGSAAPARRWWSTAAARSPWPAARC